MIRTRHLGYYRCDSSEGVGRFTGGDNWRGIVAPFFTWHSFFFQKVEEQFFFFFFSKERESSGDSPLSLTYLGSQPFITM